jgi:hypothetical protein
VDSLSHRKKLHFTLGVAPTGDLNLAHDLQMVKVALLYADSATLCSLTTSMVLSVAAMAELTPQEQIQLLEHLLPTVVPGKASARIMVSLADYKRISRKKHLTTPEILFQRQMERKISQIWNQPGGMREMAYRIAQEANADGIIQAFELDLLKIHIFDISRNDVVEEYLGIVGETVSESSSPTYPLFDDQIGHLVRLGLKEGNLTASPSSIVRGKHSGLAADLLSQLPLFEAASIEEVLDIRRELERPLIRFRSAVIRFSEEIKTAHWDEGFSTEAEQVFHKQVAPAIIDIAEAVRSNKYLSELTSRYVDRAVTALGMGSIGVLLSQYASLPDIAALALTVGLPATAIAQKTYRAWRQKQREIEQNELYFYYRAADMLR